MLEFQDLSFSKTLTDLLSNKNCTGFDRVRLTLFYLASANKESLEPVLNEAIRQIEKKEFKNLIMVFLKCYDSNVSLNIRIIELTKNLDRYLSLLDMELALLFQAAAIRWSFRFSRFNLSRSLKENYSQKSQMLCRQKDVFDLLVNLEEKLDSQVSFSDFFAGSWKKTFVCLKIVAKASFILAAYSLSVDKSEEKFQQVMVRIREYLLDSLSEPSLGIKGPLVKLIQYLGLNKLIDKTSSDSFRQYSSFNVNQLTDEKFRSQFETIEELPFAVASMSQLHLAACNDQKFAVKLLFPDIENQVKQDIAMLRLFTPLMKQVLPGSEPGEILQTLARRFSRECDLNHERKQIEKFRGFFEGDSIIEIPEVFEELSNSNVLVSRYIEAPTLTSCLSNLSEQRKIEVARSIIYFYIKSSYKHSHWYLDPHSDNFLVGDHSITVVDFGAIYESQEGFRKLHEAVFVSRYERKPKILYESLVEVGTLNPDVISLQTFDDLLSESILGPFHLDETRRVFETRDDALLNTVFKHGYSRGFTLDSRDIMTIKSSEYFRSLLSSLGLRINWNVLYREAFEMLDS